MTRKRIFQRWLLFFIGSFLFLVLAGGSFAGAPEPAGLLLAQSSQPSETQVEKAAQNMDQVKENLDRRAAELAKEFEAIQQETAEIRKIGGGSRTLRGSRAEEFVRRSRQLNQRQNQYLKDMEQLEQDRRVYREALQKMEERVEEGGETAASAAPSEDMEWLKTEIEDRRKRLVEEYEALKEEKAKISADAGSSQSSGSSVAEQMAEWDAKMKDHAQRRRSFNDAVKSFNAINGQNLPTLAPL